MARTRRTIGIDEKIAEAKEKVLRDKARFEKSCKEYEDLCAKRDAMRKDELWRLITKSERTYEEIVAYVSGPKSDD